MLALFTLPAAAPAPDPLLGQIVSSARAIAPASLAFERQSRTLTQQASGPPESHQRVDRWDGRAFTLVSVDGKPPAEKDAAAFRKATASRPVPGYHRIADMLGAGATRRSDAQGRIVYHVSSLPKDSVRLGKDISANMAGEFIVDGSGAQLYVTQARLTLTKPVSFFMVAKLDSVVITLDYKLDGNNRPYLASTVQMMAGAQFGKQGTTRSETSYTMLR